MLIYLCNSALLGFYVLFLNEHFHFNGHICFHLENCYNSKVGNDLETNVSALSLSFPGHLLHEHMQLCVFKHTDFPVFEYQLHNECGKCPMLGISVSLALGGGGGNHICLFYFWVIVFNFCLRSREKARERAEYLSFHRTTPQHLARSLAKAEVGPRDSLQASQWVWQKAGHLDHDCCFPAP